eukprot:CAMPEP_0185773512 /NCGR_PEP_ID=MMETSP1174-20130828/73858_1 /TAXON_ID=35687 /ORGANISM="Dictyocha speculum, Strain CCMP1381" /LENGTH=331 /DNA_ID=CAMNT_0028460231 /DNA_START=527 /DNA_END=1522 /DNA_ORIENTATION=+
MTCIYKTSSGGGIWCLEMHADSGLLFAGCWGPISDADFIVCWDAVSGDYVGNLRGHGLDVTCLQSVEGTLFSGSYDKTARSWDISTLSPKRIFIGHERPINGLVATANRLITASEDGTVKAWDTETASQIWSTTHPGPVTALTINRDNMIISATSCSCFNGSGYSIRILDPVDGKYTRRLEDEDWMPRKNISFLKPCGENALLVGFAAALGTVASGVVPTEQEVARTISTSVRRGQLHSIGAPAWGAQSITVHGGNTLLGTDNGRIIVSNATGSHKLSQMDVCQMHQKPTNSGKVQAIVVSGTKIFVALQDTAGFRGLLTSFELAPDELGE